ncbi:RagB/SusD family nutrient uptake outer membrane protein [Pedobacter insulae]|uniref:Starch-binding associating with outer membrane n=1 Tax=Pedobacter insulae TaxID=414048 RepID=A0A1I2VSB3_9SPHI|nr:RagB/SusD family nutrient uptake outer membrane protein [Pedobacter insulae]SFG91913.1 Starch-binding associating with outer membrane [Pedobacter insulae]
MKYKFSILFIVVATIIAFSSCKKVGFLDRKTETLTEERVFADSALTVGFINDMYAYTGQDVVPYRYSTITSPGSNDYACFDEQTTLAISYYSAPQQGLMAGTYSASNYALNNYWTTYYKKIRQATLFMQKAGATPLSPQRKTVLMAEARYLRAFFYVGLVRFYGGVQIMPNETLNVEDVLISKRNTYKECVDYIVNELDDAAKDLPSALQQDGSEYGHATKGAALALKARILLIAASPLFNGNSHSTNAALLPYVTYSATYNESLWQKAADAMKAVIDLNEYSLVEDNTTRPGHGFWKFAIKGRKTTEHIIPFIVSNGTSLESARFPRSRAGSGGGYSNPTDNAVQYFGMKNGKAINDPTSGYNPDKPFENRDPRFNYSIIYNQAPIWKSGNGTTLVPVDIYFNKASNAISADGIQAYYTKTGYYSRKMANDSTVTSSSIQRALPVMRYAEILMGYAEALNEVGQTENAVSILNQVRKRAGIEPGADGRYGIVMGIAKEGLRKIIQQDYVAEFLMEGHFWYDTRRWKTAEVTEATNIFSNYITKELNGTYSYERRVALAVNWQTRAYLAPIPQSEIDKSATLIQNPGW